MNLNIAIVCDDESCEFNNGLSCTLQVLQLQSIGGMNSVPRCNSKKIDKEYRRNEELKGDLPTGFLERCG
ncbi:MAG: hypothetical protein KAT00_02840 [Planctomycetes bacterium]|nr:hypothetical protein [Planctomycetota bacterium]